MSLYCYCKRTETPPFCDGSHAAPRPRPKPAPAPDAAEKAEKPGTPPPSPGVQD